MLAEDENVYLSFWEQMQKWSEDGTLPVCGNQDLHYDLQLQWERLKKRRLSLDMLLVPIEKFPRGNLFRRSEKYTNTLVYGHWKRKLAFYRNEKKAYSKKQEDILYATITRLSNENVSGGETYCCPNCGAISTIEELQTGCPYCHTRFLMSDLYPKVTNYFMVTDSAKTGSVKSSIAAWVLGGAAIGVLISLFFRPWNLLRIIPMAIAFGFWGYIIWAAIKIGTLIGAAGKAFSPLKRGRDAKKRIEDLMKKYDPYFLYDDFANQIVSALKILIFTEDWENLAVYEGSAQHPIFEDIIDTCYMDALGLNAYKVEEKYCYIDLDVYLECIHDNGKKVYKRQDVFRVKVCRDISKPEDLGFSIKKVKCQGCGGSFDATKERHCPFCNSAYDMKADSWVILAVGKRV